LANANLEIGGPGAAQIASKRTKDDLEQGLIIGTPFGGLPSDAAENHSRRLIRGDFEFA
jgi:hypothetical protein